MHEFAMNVHTNLNDETPLRVRGFWMGAERAYRRGLGLKSLYLRRYMLFFR